MPWDEFDDSEIYNQRPWMYRVDDDQFIFYYYSGVKITKDLILHASQITEGQGRKIFVF